MKLGMKWNKEKMGVKQGIEKNTCSFMDLQIKFENNTIFISMHKQVIWKRAQGHMLQMKFVKRSTAHQ
jgi:hypothetical protein